MSGQRHWSVHNWILVITHSWSAEWYGSNSLFGGVLDVSLRLEHWQHSSYHSVNKIRLTFHSSINVKFFYTSDAFNTHSRMHAENTHKKQTALGLSKDVGLQKNRNGWHFVGDGGTSQFNVTSCCNGPLCFAELVYWLFYTLRTELYVISMYVYIHKQSMNQFSNTQG